MTSAVVASVRKIAWPSGAFISSVIERLLRLVKAWMVRRTHSSPVGRSGSGESILRTSAPISASIMAGISAGGTRASSRILIPSRTPIALLLLRDEPRGERADVRHVLEAADLLGHALRGVGAQHRHGAAEELGVQLGVAERRRRMARGAARRGLEGGAVGQAHGRAAPRVLLQLVGQHGIDDHPHALHEVPRGGVAHGPWLEVGQADGAAGQGSGRAVLHRELPLQPVRRPRVAQHVRHDRVDADLDGRHLRGIDPVARAQLEQRVDRRVCERARGIRLHRDAGGGQLPARPGPVQRVGRERRGGHRARQRGGEEGHARVAHEGEVRVVEVVGVTRGAVGEGCPPRRRPQRGAEHRAEGNAAFRARDRAHAPRDGLRRPRDHDADRVERGASRLRQHRVGTVAQRRLDDELGEAGGGCHGRHDSGGSGRLQGTSGWTTIPAMTNRRVLLKNRPVGEPKPTDFEVVDSPVPTPKDGEILVRTVWLSLDPYMRGRMNDVKSYTAPVELGQPMVGGTVGEVVESRDAAFRPGDFVLSYGGWQAYHVAKSGGARVGPFGPLKLDPKAAPISTALGILGMPGMTAYVGLYDIGQPKPGETVVVSAAAGAVGSVVGQLAKIRGCRTVGIASRREKCEHVLKDLDFDACVSYRVPELGTVLRDACPNGIDVYFDNVGGDVLKAVLKNVNPFARIPLCGIISQYNATEMPPGPNLAPVLVNRVTIRGFIVSDHADRMPQFLADCSRWLREGKLKYREDIVEGLEKAPEAFIGLLRGRNLGKMLVKVGEDRTRR